MSESKPKVVVLISGRGSNLKRLILLQKNYEIIAVISNRRKAIGLNYAREADIPFYIFDKRDYNSVQEQQSALHERLKQLAPTWICLAGFLQILAPEIVKEFEGRIINVHPSLLPKLKGSFGLNCHQAAIELGETQHGCSIHFVENEIDSGLIIAQATCAVLPNDTAEILSKRVLELEHKLYPWVLNHLAAGNISIKHQLVSFSEPTIQEAATSNFFIDLTTEHRNKHD